MLRRIVCKSPLLQFSKLNVAFRLAKEERVERSMEWVSIAEQLHPKCRMQWYNRCRHWTLEERRCVPWNDESCFFIWLSDG